jgi:hypothetical protein
VQPPATKKQSRAAENLNLNLTIIMKKLFTTFTLFILLASQLFAQEDVYTFDSFHKNIYGELFGSHIISGVNFDMRLKKGRTDGIGFRAGVGGLSVSGVDQNTTLGLGLVTFPLEFNHLVGKKRSFLVTGIGILPVYGAVNANGEITNNEYFSEEGFAIVGGFITFGYRFQPKKSGIMFQANWNPLIIRGSGFQASWIGLGLGFGFK